MIKILFSSIILSLTLFFLFVTGSFFYVKNHLDKNCQYLFDLAKNDPINDYVNRWFSSLSGYDIASISGAGRVDLRKGSLLSQKINFDFTVLGHPDKSGSLYFNRDKIDKASQLSLDDVQSVSVMMGRNHITYSVNDLFAVGEVPFVSSDQHFHKMSAQTYVYCDDR